MKKINNGFSTDLYLSEQGLVYNAKTKRYLKLYNDHCYRLKDYYGRQKTITLKSLYQLVFHRVFCVDSIPDLEGQIWKPIENTNNEYYCSNHSRIKSYKGYEAIILKPWINKKKNGYLVVKITVNGKPKNVSVHKLVASTFLPKPENTENYQIHHKRFQRFKNSPQDLQWVTKEEHKKIHDQYNAKQQQKKVIE